MNQIKTKQRAFQEAHILAGIPTFFRVPHVPFDIEKLKEYEITVGIIGVPHEGGNTYRPGASYGPHSLRTATAQFAGYLHHLDFDLFKAYNIADCGDVPVHPIDINIAHRQVADCTKIVFGAGAIPILIGGDHSITTGGVVSLSESISGNIGLLILDAHLDTKESIGGKDVNSHGSWIAKVVKLPNLLPTNIVIIGVRGASIPHDCWDFVYKSGITVITMEEIWQTDILTAVEKGLKIVRKNTDSFYVSYDIDSIDPAYAPGTGAPEPGGLSSHDVLQAAYAIGNAKPASFDVVELFMNYDPSGITATLAGYIILYTLAGRGKKN